MPKNIQDQEFRAWVDGIFSSFDRNDRWCDDDFDTEELPPDERVRRLTRLFHECGTVLAKYPDDHVGRGLSYLGNGGISEYPAAIFDPAPDQARIACVQAMERLYLDCWVKRCVPEPSSLVDARTGRLNGSCYMWWDLLGYRGDRHIAMRKPLDAACLHVMEKALEISHIACQESALHGLNHWTGDYSGEVRQIIDRFLYKHPEADEYIRDYAKVARKGLL